MKSDERYTLIRDVMRIIAVTAFFGSVIYILQLPHVRQDLFDVTRWRESTRSFGRAAWLFIMGAFVIANTCGVPRIWISAIAGGLFGAFEGSIIAQLATLSGAILNFFTGRWLLQGLIVRRLPARFRIWQERFGENGFRWIFYIRIFPFSNATAVNLMSGASPVRFGDFVAATFLGYLPFTITFALFGSSVAKQKIFQLVFAAVLFSAVILLRLLYQRRHPPGLGGNELEKR